MCSLTSCVPAQKYRAALKRGLQDPAARSSMHLYGGAMELASQFPFGTMAPARAAQQQQGPNPLLNGPIVRAQLPSAPVPSCLHAVCWHGHSSPNRMM